MPDLRPAWFPTRHDLLLAAIATPLVIAGLLAATVSLPASYLLGAGSVPASVGLGYALFYRPPDDAAE